MGSCFFPKDLWCWGFMNIHHFIKALAAKCLWRLIEGDGLWCHVIHPNHILLDSIKDWISKPNKRWCNGSIFWKALMLASYYVKKKLVWKVGNGTRVRIGSDPWVKCGKDLNFLRGL